MSHTFHIPVLGLAYTIDTPLKVAKFGINSVVSIIQDELLEFMREFHAKNYQINYEPITKHDFDYRAARITAYLNLMHQVVTKQIEQIKLQTFLPNTDLTKYFNLLPATSFKKQLFDKMLQLTGDEKVLVQQQLKEMVTPGNIDVNIMTKIDNNHYKNDTKDLDMLLFSDAQAALRGFANSVVSSSLILSAGLNPRLFSYIETFKDFFPDNFNQIKKRIIIKVSDYRSALVQGKILAKKGIWVSEFRIESGLNCGGHAFPTDGNLMGGVLEEFKLKRQELTNELKTMVNNALAEKNMPLLSNTEEVKVSVQGGIGTYQEDAFLKEYYGVDYTGWGSPFLMVPEATNVDDETLAQLVNAKKEDYYLSYASPLGVPFNNFRKSSSNAQRLQRVSINKPGSPCFKKHLAFSNEFSKNLLCTASRKYQHHKILEAKQENLSAKQLTQIVEEITEKDCLCEGLTSSALLKNNLKVPHNLTAVAICPGPNLAYFSGVFSLNQMVDHIYGRALILNKLDRKHMFINEAALYIDYLKNEIVKYNLDENLKKKKYFIGFKENLINSLKYYFVIADKLGFTDELLEKITEIEAIEI